MNIDLPNPSLVVLIGASGSGKSSFARAHFKPTEVISSDFCRGLITDDENNQAASRDAFALVDFIASKRLEQPRLTVIDATSVQREARRSLVELARRHDLFPVAVVLNMPESLCLARNKERPDRDFGPHVVRQQRAQLRKSLRHLRREGFRHTWVLSDPEEVEAVTVTRKPLWTDRRTEVGQFDVIGDVHGCHVELVELLGKLGYEVAPDGLNATPPAGRRAIFVGDFVDRGPDSPSVLKLAMAMAAHGDALCVPGNHDAKLVRKLKGRKVQVTHGLAETLGQLAGEPEEFGREVHDFLDGLVSHMVLDEGRLVVAHAGMKQSYQGRSSRRVRDFALFGETTGETDEFGLPVRADWAEEYRGDAVVVYGHTPIAQAEWVNDTINIDTGCVFGGRLTALRWPERELVEVPALKTYYEPAKPFIEPEDAAASETEPRDAFVLDVNDIAGKRVVDTRLARRVSIRADQAAAAMEVMSRFAIDPRWLIYLPPTMAPPATSRLPDLLEHPDQAFAEFRDAGVAEVICEEKHMGSRAIAVVCRDTTVAAERFGVADGTSGALYTRTGRPFFNEPDLTELAIEKVRAAASASGMWESLETDWVVLDCELLPWSAKAGDLIRRQYAAVGSAALMALGSTVDVLERAAARGLDIASLLERQVERQADVEAYREAYGRYVSATDGLEGVQLAPFHVLASEQGVHVDKPHDWHLGFCDALVSADGSLFKGTERLAFDVTDPASQAEAVEWWQTLTKAGGEGMVVKPAAFLARGRKGLVQPGIKCRGREYLRIIYGPEYVRPHQIERLRSRGLGKKRALAQREFALGVEALERFVRREPLYKTHEAVFGVLALESEPVDPRL